MTSTGKHRYAVGLRERTERALYLRRHGIWGWRRTLRALVTGK